MVDAENQPAVANGGAAVAEAAASEAAAAETGDVMSPLEKKIVRQIEHYFGDYNLPRDKFLQVGGHLNS